MMKVLYYNDELCTIIITFQAYTHTWSKRDTTEHVHVILVYAKSDGTLPRCDQVYI